MGISASAVLVELNISVWTANKLDRGATGEVTISKKAASNAAQVRKNLMAGTSLRKDIADYATGCRSYHSTHTLPWADHGMRLLPTSLFFDYKTELNTRRERFNQMVNTFVDNYPSLIQVSQTYLGDLFDPDDYPSADDVRSKFDFRLVFSPVPEAGDFRLDIGQQDLVDMREQYESSFNRRIAEAMREPWEKLHKTLTAMSEKLTDVVGEDAPKKRYHDSLVTNAVELCEMLTHLNITKDPELERARQMLQATMRGADIEVIKESPYVRETMKRNVDAILKQYDW